MQQISIMNQRCLKHHRSTQGGDDVAPAFVMSTSAYKTQTFSRKLKQRFSNWGPWTKEGPRRVPTGSARGFRKVVILFARFLTIYDPYVFKFAHISQSLSLSALRGSVAVVWHDRLSVDVS